ncbi:MAG: TonB-dependent receptor plug domain-containing protein [Mangrovibacterium sp.]
MSFDELMNLKVTTGSKYESSVGKTHSAVHVISAHEIQAYGIENLGELLNLIRGIYISNDRNYIYVGVQGFSRPTDYNNRLLLMIDNHILNENVYGSALMDNGFGLEMQFIERVEVITGPGAALYGNGAMMAVVNVITVPEEEKGNKVRLKAGSKGTLGSSFALSDKLEASSWFVSGNAFKSSGEDLFFNELTGQGNDGHAVGLDDEEVYSAYAQYNQKNFGVKLLGSHRMKGIPAGPWETRLDKRSESVDERAFGELNYQRSFSNQSVRLSSSWDLYRYKGEYGYADADYYYDQSVGSWGNLQLEYQIDLDPKSKLIAGAEWHYSAKSNYREEEDGIELFYKNNRFSNSSLFVQYDYILNSKFRFLAGLRLDDYSYTNASLSPRISAIYTPNNNLNIRYSFNKAFRAPNFYEMFYESEGENTSNPHLSHENIFYHDLDIMKKLTANLHGGVSFFCYRMKKMIDPIINHEELTMFINTGDGSGRGGQAYFEGSLFKNLTFHTSYTYQYLTTHSSPDNKSRATNFPASMLKARLIWQIPKTGSLGWQNGWESSRKTIDGEKTSSYWSSALNIKTVPLFDRLSFMLKINNLFDQIYYQPAGLEHTMDQIVQPRRYYLFSIEIKL